MRLTCLFSAILVATLSAPGVADVSVVVDAPTLAPPVEVEVQTPAPAPPVVVHSPVVHAAPVMVAPAPVCCPIEVVRDRALPSATRAYRCHGGPVTQTICAENPADRCPKLYSVAVCVPACCTGPPVLCESSVGLLGRGRSVYRWPCGFEAVLTFRVHGGVLITYR